MKIVEIQKESWPACLLIGKRGTNWGFERYNCPRFTTPDGEGNVVLDYGIAVE